MDTKRYQARIRVRQRQLAMLAAHDRRALAERARARSARRWEDNDARPDQERRAGRLQLVRGDAEPVAEGVA